MTTTRLSPAGQEGELSCRMLHHGAAATSSSKAVICIPSPSRTSSDSASTSSSCCSSSTEIVYASNAILNIAHQLPISVETKIENVWNVYQTLRTSTKASPTANSTVATITAKRVITCIGQLKSNSGGNNEDAVDTTILVCGFSDGSITTWSRNDDEGSDPDSQQWTERIIVTSGSQHYDDRAITDIGGIYCKGTCYKIVTCSSGGAYNYTVNIEDGDDSTTTTTTTNDNNIIKHGMVVHTAANTVRYQSMYPKNSDGISSATATTLILVGTAAPRHNKIHVFLESLACERDLPPQYCGSLTGHEDWLTCFDWFSFVDSEDNKNNNMMMASGSQDAKIRLWKFTKTSTTTTTTSIANINNTELHNTEGNDDEDEEDNAELEEDMMDEGEARLEIVLPETNNTNSSGGDDKTVEIISVYLEALLIGHEERVTAITWHPKPREVYGQELILFSSSMDRTILIWSALKSGVWTPVSRVGSAGGILGGPIGSSLLGFVNVLIEPNDGKWLAGHGYGGAIHFFSCDKAIAASSSTKNENTDPNPEDPSALSIEERAALIPWRAQPCLTGHFDGVTDLCWEADHGDYLVTVSNDHTCRIWFPFASAGKIDKDVWVEIARPQVHGYNLSTITSLSLPGRRHTLISGADEKEIRVFDATQAFTRLLERAISSTEETSDDSESAIERVERAYIPSLGLSNKATAADGAEEDTASGVSASSTSLPLERDLGSVSIWPEVLKLFGHSTELARLTSTLSAQSGALTYTSQDNHVLVASTAKARDPKSACIRLWDVKENKCVQILAGGHKSTVTAIGFSSDGKYLASSGKDRRLCLWQKQKVEQGGGAVGSRNFALVDAVDSSHKRIVWSLHFCPVDPLLLASGSRDGTIKIWNIIAEGDSSEAQLKELYQIYPSYKETTTTKFESVTALAFAPAAVSGMAVLAMGLECGVIEIWKIPLVGADEAKNPELVMTLPPRLCHIESVTKLAWRPIRSSNDGEQVRFTLASSSSDHGCRVFEIATSS